MTPTPISPGEPRPMIAFIWCLAATLCGSVKLACILRHLEG